MCIRIFQISFFSLPLGNKKLLEQWLQAITKDEVKEMKEVNRGTKLCSRHFNESDYYSGYLSGRRYLRDGSVPHIFKCKPPKSEPSDAICLESMDAAAVSTSVQKSWEEQPGKASFVGAPVKARMCYSSDWALKANRAASAMRVTVCCSSDWVFETNGTATTMESGGNIAEEVSMDPVHTYCKPPEKRKADCLLPPCSVRVVAECGNEDSDPDASVEDLPDTGVEVLAEDSEDLQDTGWPEVLPDTSCPGNGCSSEVTSSEDMQDAISPENVCSSEAMFKIDKLEKFVSKLQQEVERESYLVASYRQDMKDAKEERLHLARAVELLERKCQRLEKSRFSVESLRGRPKALQFYTGLPEYAVFEDIFQRLDPGPAGENVRPADGQRKANAGGRRRSLTVRDELFLLLIRCRLALLEQDLAFRFSISRTAVTHVCTAWTRFVYSRLNRLLPNRHAGTRCSCAPSANVTRNAGGGDTLGLKSCLPSSHELSDSGRVVTLDSLDSATIFVYPPMDLASTESATHASECPKWPTNSSTKADDPTIVVEEVLLSVGVPADISLLLGRHRPGDGSVLQTEEIASLQRDIKRTVPKIQNYRIFDRPVPLSLLPVAKELLAVCAVLTTFQSCLYCMQDK